MSHVRIYLQKPCDNGTKALLIKAFDNYNDSTFSSVKKTTITKYVPKNYRYYDPPSKHAIKKGADLYLRGMDMDDGRISTFLEFTKRNTEVKVDTNYDHNLDNVLKILIARRVKFMVERLDIINHPYLETKLKNYLTSMLPHGLFLKRLNTRPINWK